LWNPGNDVRIPWPGTSSVRGGEALAEVAAALLERIRDVLQEKEAEHDVLVLGQVHAGPEEVGGFPQLRFEAERGAIGAPARSPAVAEAGMMEKLNMRRN
jgi:hypothetical protein